jgi:nicotinamide-nucleotide amidase
MNAIILSVGDELVLGQSIDTNSAWISQELAAIGCEVIGHATVGDDAPRIARTILAAAGQCDVLIISGGLGPTEDDLTRGALAAALGQPLELDAGWLAEIEAFFQKVRRPMPPANRVQAMIPRGARAIFNTAGTAAGIDATLRAGDRSCHVFSVPGVPSEMKTMLRRDVLGHLAAQASGAVIRSRLLRTFGRGESAVGTALGDLMRRDRNPSVGTTVSEGEVALRLNARFDSADRAEAELDRTESACRAALGDLIYGAGEQSLAQVVAGLLTARTPPWQVTVAESCTGGLLGTMLTDIPGSSRYFSRGWIVYSNDAKEQWLGVPLQILTQHGAVSEPTVLAMASAARQKASADIALAISGIAGPDGAVPGKPVGTVCIALAHPAGAQAVTHNYPGDRQAVRLRAAKMALTMLRYHLLGRPIPG